MLKIEGLHVRRGAFSLGPLSLDVPEGEYFVLLGPSGAGKTTLLEWLVGFHRAQAGTLLLGGRDVTAEPPRNRPLAVVFQDLALFPHLPVRENLAFALRVEGWAEDKVASRVQELAELLRITHRLDASVGSLSGGEARRVALGRALAAGRKVLLLDEPLSGLDPGLRRDVRYELARLHRELGLTVVHITHHLGEARNLATRLGVLLDGGLAQSGTPEQVFRHPAGARVAKALMIPNFVEGVGVPGAGVFRLGPLLSVPAAVRKDGPLHARVEGLSLSSSHLGSGLWEATLRGLERAEGGRMHATVALPTGEGEALFEIPVPASLPAVPRPGDTVYVDFSSARWEFYE